MKRVVCIILALIMCMTICACGGGATESKIKEKIDGTAWGSGSNNVATDGTAHALGWGYVFSDGIVAASMSVAVPNANSIVLGTATGSYEISDNVIYITWEEVKNTDGSSTIWEVGRTDELKYTYQNNVLVVYAPDGSIMEQVN